MARLPITGPASVLLNSTTLVPGWQNAILAKPPPCKPTMQSALLNNSTWLKKFISPETPYKTIYLYHGVGVGKTCASIQIADNFKNYYNYQDCFYHFFLKILNTILKIKI